MRTRVRRRRGAVALVVGAAVVWALSGPVAGAVGLGHGPAPSSRIHVVRAGETLWSIATDHDSTRDPREVVQAIQTANRLDPAGLVPGEQIVLPELG